MSAEGIGIEVKAVRAISTNTEVVELAVGSIRAKNKTSLITTQKSHPCFIGEITEVPSSCNTIMEGPCLCDADMISPLQKLTEAPICADTLSPVGATAVVMERITHRQNTAVGCIGDWYLAACEGKPENP